MVKVQFIEVFIRLIPEILLYIWGSYVVTKTKFNSNKFLLSSLIATVGAFLVRQLPIQMGINTVLSMIIVIVVNITINKIKPIKAVQASMLIVVILFMSEALNVVFIKTVLNADMNAIFKDPIMKTIYGLPSLVILGLTILGIKLMPSKKKVIGSTVKINTDN